MAKFGGVIAAVGTANDMVITIDDRYMTFVNVTDKANLFLLRIECHFIKHSACKQSNGSFKYHGYKLCNKLDEPKQYQTTEGYLLLLLQHANHNQATVNSVH